MRKCNVFQDAVHRQIWELNIVSVNSIYQYTLPVHFRLTIVQNHSSLTPYCSHGSNEIRDHVSSDGKWGTGEPERVDSFAKTIVPISSFILVTITSRLIFMTLGMTLAEKSVGIASRTWCSSLRETPVAHQILSATNPAYSLRSTSVDKSQIATLIHPWRMYTINSSTGYISKSKASLLVIATVSFLRALGLGPQISSSASPLS